MSEDEVGLRRHLSGERERPVAHKRSHGVDERRAEQPAAPPPHLLALAVDAFTPPCHVADSDATIVGSAFRETDKSVTIQESVGGSTKTAAGADTSTFPSRALFDFDEPTKDPTGAVSQTGIHVPFFRSGTSKNWYYAARAA